MISFKRWALSGKLDARQADDYTAEFRVSGLLPGYTWELLWNYGSNLDVIPLELNDGGDIGIATLTKDNLAFSGTYVAQLRATTPNGGIKHTDKLELNISDSFTEDAHWPVVPRAFSEYVEGVADDVANEINARIKPPFFATVSHTPYADVVAAYEAKRFIVAVDSTWDTYAMIHHEPGQRFEFGGLNPITGQAKYWELRYEDGHNVWATGTKNYARSNTIDTSDSLPTCKAVYDELTKYYDKTVVDNAIAAAKAEAAQALASHNADALAHPVIRQLITDLANRLNALADSDDATLDQLSEIVAYIKSNKSLIDIVTTSKVSVSDIVNNLTSTATNKPLSAAQGAVLKAAVDALEAEVEASKVIVLDPDNLPDNAFNMVAEASNARRLCCMRFNRAGYLFLQARFVGEDYYTFISVDKDGKLIKRKLYMDNTLSNAEASDISNVFIGDDDTTYIQWRNHIDAGQVCVWRSRVYHGDFYYQSTGTEGLTFIGPSRSLVEELIKKPDNTTAQYLGRIPTNPSSAQAGYVLTATATGSATWAPPTGGSGGGGNTVVFDEATVTYDSVAAAVNAGKVVHLWRTDEDGERESLTLVLVPETVPGDPFNFVSGVINDNESESLIVRTAILHSTNELLFGVEHIASMDYVRQVVVDALPTLIQQSTDQVKLAIIMFSDNKLYLLDAAAETQIELTFDVLTQLVIARPTIVLDFTNGTVYTFNKAGLDGSSIVFSRTDGNTTSTVTMAADNTVTVAETNNDGSPPVLDFDGNHLYKDGEQLTYAVLKELVASRPDTIVSNNGVIYILNVDRSNADAGYISFSRQEVGNDKALHTTITMSSDSTIRVAQSIAYGIPQPTSDDNGKALVAQDGAAVWKEIAGGGGGSQSFRLIREVVIPEDITTDTSGVNFAMTSNGGVLFGFDTDQEGNPFEVTELITVAEAGMTGTQDHPSFAIDDAVPKYGAYKGGVVQCNLTVGKGAIGYSYAYTALTDKGSSVSWGASFGGGANNNVTSPAREDRPTNYKTVKAIRSYFNNAAADGYIAGSKLRFYGR